MTAVASDPDMEGSSLRKAVWLDRQPVSLPCGPTDRKLWGLLVLAMSMGLAQAQPTTMEFPKPFASKHWPSPYVVGMPRSGAKVPVRLSISSSLPPGVPGGPAVVAPEDEGGPRDPTPIRGPGIGTEARDDDDEMEGNQVRERFPVRGSAQFPSNFAPLLNESFAPAPAPDDETFEPNSLGAVPGTLPIIPGSKIFYEGAEDGVGLLVKQFAGIQSSDQPSVKYRPPDMALCVGDDVVLTATNLIIRTYNASTGTALEGPIDFSQFLGLDSNFSDVACIFDAQDTRRFYLTVFGYGSDEPHRYSLFAVAVSKSSRPSDGFYGPFIIRNDGLDPANDTLPGLEECAAWNSSYTPGCLGDYPVVGIDQHALWASFNLFQTEPGPDQTFAGPLVMGISKRDMMYGQYTNPAVAYISNFDLTISYTIAPSWTQPGTPHDTRFGGTLFLFNTGPNTQLAPPLPAVALWAITNTSRLDDADFPLSGVPKISKAVVLDTLEYMDPAILDGFNLTQPAPGYPLDPSDARTTQLSLSGPYLWSTVQTAASVGKDEYNVYMAAIYWGIFPFFDEKGNFNATTFSTGYVGVEGHDLGRPAIVGLPDGQTAWMTGFITSPGLNMSPFYVGIQAYDGPGQVRVPVIAPDILRPTNRSDRPIDPDGLYGQGFLRAGDYSAATMDEEGNIWMATEWSGGQVAPLCDKLFPGGRCPNWSTYIMEIPRAQSYMVRHNYPTSKRR